MTIFVGSLKYSPVFKSHCCAFGKACEEEGYEVRYLFSHAYEWMLSEEVKAKTVFVGNSVDSHSMMSDALNIKNRQKIKDLFFDRPTAIYMQNFHLLNYYLAELSREKKCRFIYHVHEPYVSNKKAHGRFQKYWLDLFEYFQKRLILNSEIAIVSSKYAASLFDEEFSDFAGKRLLVPLLFEDLGNSRPSIKDRTHVTFVGPPFPAKNPEKFLDIVGHSLARDPGLRFLLVSRLRLKDPRYFKRKNLSIVEGERISDAEFGNLVSHSIALLVPYKRETQSSAIIISYMHGTPVLSSNIGGLSEFVFNGKTGFLLSPDSQPDEWLDKISFLQANLAEISENCRQYFKDSFAGENWKMYLNELLE